MAQKWAGGGLLVNGFGLYGFVALDRLGIVTLEFETLFLSYGLLIVVLGAGVYAEEIQFADESAAKYEGFILLYAILIVITLFGVTLISVA